MPTHRSIFKNSVAILGIVAFLLGIWIVGTDGLSSLWATYALEHVQIGYADKAISFNKRNPEANYARATLYRLKGQTREAIKDLERAVDLKKGDHFLRVELGYTRYLTGDIQGATRDFEDAVRHAPYYAQPRWYLGNMLLEAGKFDEGFAELRRAVKSDPVYFTDTIQRAAVVYDGDHTAIVKAVMPESSQNWLELMRYFIRQDNIPAAMELFRTRKVAATDDMHSLLNDLLAAKRFADAREVWLATSEVNGRPQSKDAFSLSNAGFESEIDPKAIGFEWQVAESRERFQLTRDSKEFFNGSYSLLVEFNGNSSQAIRVFSQLVLVEPEKDYRLSFAVQSKDLVTGALPFVTVTDANDGKSLGYSSSFPAGTNGWRNYEIICKTTPETQAVIIGLQRGGCPSANCPAFGRLWFDDFNWQAR